MDFYVYCEEKSEDHPLFGKGSKKCFVFVINDKKFYGDILLTIGQIYRFHIQSEDHPFYITKSSSGSMIGILNHNHLNISGNIGVEKGSLLVFKPDESYLKGPPIYYQCTKHLYMGGMFLFIKPSDNRILKKIASKVTSAIFRNEKIYFCQNGNRVYRKNIGNDNTELIYTSEKQETIESIEVSPNEKDLWTTEKDITNDIVYVCKMGKKKFGIKSKEKMKSKITFHSDETIFFSYGPVFYRLELKNNEKIYPSTNNPYYCQPDKNHYFYSEGFNKPNKPSWRKISLIEEESFVTDGIDIIKLLPEKSQVIFSYDFVIGTGIVGSFFENDTFKFADESGRIFKFDEKKQCRIMFVAEPDIFFSDFIKGNQYMDFLITNNGDLFSLEKKILSGAKIIKKINDLIDEQKNKKNILDRRPFDNRRPGVFNQRYDGSNNQRLLTRRRPFPS